MNVTFDGNGLPPTHLLKFYRPQNIEKILLVREMSVDIGARDSEHDGYLYVYDTQEGRHLRGYHAWVKDEKLIINNREIQETTTDLDGIKVIIPKSGKEFESPGRQERI